MASSLEVSEATTEASPLLLSSQASDRWRANRVVTTAIPLIFFIKIANHVFESMMKSIDVLMPNCSSNCSTAASEATTTIDNSATFAAAVTLLILSFILPTLGGLLSDAWLGSFKMLCVATFLNFIGCSVLTILSQFNITGQVTPIASMLKSAPIRIFMGFGDTMLLYIPMLYATDSDSRILIMSLYYITPGFGQFFGFLPYFLRDAIYEKCEFIGVIFNACSLLCVFLLRRSHQLPGANSPNYFRLPKLIRLRRFYLIAACAIPYQTTSFILYTLYSQQLRHIHLETSSSYEDSLASYIGIIGLQSGSIVISTITAFLAYRHWVPDWFTLKFRVRVGLWVMAITKLTLLLIVTDSRAKSMDPSVAWAVCFCFAFSDGLFGALSSMAFYETISCVAVSSNSPATFIGIFYTTWGFSALLQFGLETLMNIYLEKSYLYAAYGIVISLMLVSIAYWEKVSYPMASGPLVDYEIELSENFLRFR